MQCITVPEGASLPRSIRLGPEKVLVDRPAAPAPNLFSRFLASASQPSLRPGYTSNWGSNSAQALSGVIQRVSGRVQPILNLFNETAPPIKSHVAVDQDAFFCTPEEFTRKVYGILQKLALNTKIAGCLPAADYSDGVPHPYRPGLRDDTTVNISESNSQTPKRQTIEFKHHFAGLNLATGTDDTIPVRCWIEFCASLFNYAAYPESLRIVPDSQRFITELMRQDLLVSDSHPI